MDSSRTEKVKKCLTSKVAREMRLPGAIIVGALIGVALGVGLRSRGLSRVESSLLFLPGDIMLQLMKMLLLPITISSVVVSMASMDVKTTGKIGIRALVYYLSTLVIACAVGISMSLMITPEPIYGPVNGTASEEANSSNPGVAFTDLIRLATTV